MHRTLIKVGVLHSPYAQIIVTLCPAGASTVVGCQQLTACIRIRGQPPSGRRRIAGRSEPQLHASEDSKDHQQCTLRLGQQPYCMFRHEVTTGNVGTFYTGFGYVQGGAEDTC